MNVFFSINLTLCLLMDSSLVCYNKLGMVHCTYIGVLGYNFPKILYFLSKDRFYLYRQCRPRRNAASCCISPGFSLFVKVLVWGFPEYKELNMCFGCSEEPSHRGVSF